MPLKPTETLRVWQYTSAIVFEGAKILAREDNPTQLQQPAFRDRSAQTAQPMRQRGQQLRFSVRPRKPSTGLKLVVDSFDRPGGWQRYLLKTRRLAHQRFGIPLAFLHVVRNVMMLWKCQLLICFMTVLPAVAQDIAAPDPQIGNINGTVLDVYGDIVPGALVTLQCSFPCENRTQTANDTAAFNFRVLKFGVPYQVRISVNGFENWTSPAIVLTPDHSVFLVTGIKLQIADPSTTVTVYGSTDQIAVEQVHLAEQQRVLGFIPNFYVVYDSENAVPLTTKLKFQLAMRVSVDPVTVAGVAFMAGVRQTAHSPDYGLGAKGYGQRFGAEIADGFSDILIGGAVLPSLLHQDPRYFYQGTGTTRSRLQHALASPFICKGDNGRWQPNYSSVGGDLASSALMNTYYPQSNRGTGLVFGQFAISTAERELSGVVQEFVLRKLTRGARKAQ